MPHVNTAPATNIQITDANLSLEAKMIESTYIENLTSQHGKLLLAVEDKQQRLSELERLRDETNAKIDASLGPDGRRTQATRTLQQAESGLITRHSHLKSDLGAAQSSLRELERLLSAESQVQKHRETLLNSQTQLVDAEARKRRVDTVCNELKTEVTREEESLQRELNQHAGHQLEARLAGDTGSSLPQAIADLQTGISGKRATLTAAENRKLLCAEEVDVLQKKIIKAKKDWQEARLALAELKHGVAVQGIMPALATLLAAMRESGNGFSKTSITVNIDVEDIEAARVELRKELLRDG